MANNKKAKIWATIIMIYIILMFIELITFGSGYLFVIFGIFLILSLLSLVWYSLYMFFEEVMNDD